jgi:pyruvate formate-lyase activating enzyme-like uncharacterized protein
MLNKSIRWIRSQTKANGLNIHIHFWTSGTLQKQSEVCQNETIIKSKQLLLQ